MPATDILGKIGEKVGGQIKSLETSITNDFATKAELSTLQTEVDANQSGTGLGASGGYPVNAASNYLASATSLVDADNKLDAQILANGDQIAAVNESLGQEAQKIATNSSNIFANEQAIDAVEASAGLASDGSYNAETSSNYINGATSLAEADALLDAQIASNATDISTAASNISTLTTDKFDKSGGTISGGITINGDLIVSGATTTVTSTEVSVADNNIEVNLKSDGSVTASSGGFNVNRGVDIEGLAAPKAGLIWDNDNSTWKLVLGTANADLVAGTVTADLTGDVTGNLTGDVTGVVTVPNANGLIVNSTALGDYATFESAFNAAIA